MDAAEAWLREHDPNYAGKDWTDEDGDDFTSTDVAQEVPWGNDADLDELLYPTAEGERRVNVYVRPVGNRLCEACGTGFVPVSSLHRFCKEKCRRRGENRRSYERRKFSGES